MQQFVVDWIATGKRKVVRDRTEAANKNDAIVRVAAKRGDIEVQAAFPSQRTDKPDTI